MKYFVTGATGFIGGEVARQLAAEGHEVTALVRSPDKAGHLKNLGIHLVPGDITEPQGLTGAMRGMDGLFHLAAWYKIGTPSAQAFAINVQGTRNVLEAMRQADVPRGVYTSTVGVFSDTHGQTPDESYTFHGPFLSAYEETKWKAHYEVAVPMMKAGLPLIIAMPGVVYGPGDTSLVAETLRDYLKGKLPATAKGCAFCWAHVEDTARGHILAMEKGKVGETYIIAGPVHSLIETFALAERLTGIKAPRLHPSPGMMRLMAALAGVAGKVIPLPAAFQAESLRSVAGVTYTASNAKAKRELGFDPRPFEEGLKETLLHEMKQLKMRV